METKHTPGPWHIQEGGFTKNAPRNEFQIYATNDDLELICKVYHDGLLAHSFQDHEANAKLIAAAPELLEVAQIIVGLPGFEKDEYYGELLLKAIKKATS